MSRGERLADPPGPVAGTENPMYEPYYKLIADDTPSDE